MDEQKLFHSLFTAMGMLLLAIVTWIGSNVAHIPAIEQKIDDYHASETATLEDHESRIRMLEVGNYHHVGTQALSH